MRRTPIKPNAQLVDDFDEQETQTDSDKELVSEAMLVPTAKQALVATEPRLMPPMDVTIEQFIVSNHDGRSVMLHGGLVLLRRGKVVDNLNYDLAYLKSQGVQLQPYVETK
jgi:hypothetical protein